MTTAYRSRLRRLATLALLCALPAAAHAAAKVSIMPPEIDFGRLEQNVARTASLIVRNEGDMELKIMNVESSCGCTAAKPGQDTLAPGESTTIEVTFNSKEFQGPQHKTITVQTNDPLRPMIEIPVLADVHAPLAIEPIDKSVSFGKVPLGQGAEQTVEFSTPDLPVLNVELIKTRDDLFVVEITQGAAANTRRATIRLKPGVPSGLVRELLTFRTNVPQHTQVDIAVTGTVLSPVSLTPEEINFRYSVPNVKMTRTFVLRPQEGVVVTVKEATIDLPGFTVTSVTRNAVSGETLIEISGLPLAAADPAVVAAKGRMSGTLHVRTDSKVAPEVTAAVKYLIKL
jgi:hypothetical protein